MRAWRWSYREEPVLEPEEDDFCCVECAGPGGGCVYPPCRCHEETEDMTP